MTVASYWDPRIDRYAAWCRARKPPLPACLARVDDWVFGYWLIGNNYVSKRSCPIPWCRSGAPEQRWLRVQAAMTGRLMDAVSLIVPSVSRLM
jgi:hypothetical protein